MTRPSPSPLWREAIIVFPAGGLYWTLAAQLSFVSEPWDAPLYWSMMYPFSLATAGALGAATAWRPAVIGLGLTMPQFLIVAMATGATPGLFIALGFVAALSAPAILAAWSARAILRRG